MLHIIWSYQNLEREEVERTQLCTLSPKSAYYTERRNTSIALSAMKLQELLLNKFSAFYFPAFFYNSCKIVKSWVVSQCSLKATNIYYLLCLILCASDTHLTLDCSRNAEWATSHTVALYYSISFWQQESPPATSPFHYDLSHLSVQEIHVAVFTYRYSLFF